MFPRSGLNLWRCVLPRFHSFLGNAFLLHLLISISLVFASLAVASVEQLSAKDVILGVSTSLRLVLEN